MNTTANMPQCLPESEPGDTLSQDENGIVWLRRVDGTPVLAMSERTYYSLVRKGQSDDT